MKKILALMIFFSLASYVSAQSLYVTDSFEITLRTGQGIEHKIVGMLKSGEKIDLLEQGEEWSKIKRSNGKEGWVLTRFLKTDAPNAAKLQILTGKYDSLLASNEKNQNELNRLRAENANLKSVLKSVEVKFENLSSDYKKLKTESQDYLELKAKYEKASRILKDKKEVSQDLEKKLTERNIKIFIAGAAVMLIGFIFGMSSKRKKRGLYY